MTACAPEPEPEPVQLSITAAGGAYLDAVCPVNDAWDELDLAVDQLRLALDAGGESTAAEEMLAEALDDLGAASVRAARALEDTDQVWPAGAAQLVTQVAESLRADGAEAARVMKLAPEKAATLSWPGVAESAETATAARAALGLPADSAAACAERPRPEPPAADVTGTPGEPGTQAPPKDTEKPAVTTSPGATTKPAEGAKP